MTFLFGIIIFLNLLEYIIFIDVILSWLTLFGIHYKPKFLVQITEPMYRNIKKIIPTSIGNIEFVPIVVLIIILFIKGILFRIYPELQSIALNLLS